MIEQILNRPAHRRPRMGCCAASLLQSHWRARKRPHRRRPEGIPNNLVPYVAQVAIGKMKAVRVFGNDYPTPDGTGVRDYIHVVDLARGHVAALNWMDGKTGVEVVNLGTGKGSSVLDVVAAFSRACGHELPVDIQPRRAGDVAENYADPQKAKDVFGWVAEYDLDRMCADSWRWQSMNRTGMPTKRCAIILNGLIWGAAKMSAMGWLGNLATLSY